MADRNIMKLLSVTVAAMLTTLSSVFYAQESKVFSHKRHIEEYGAECANCHDAAADPPSVKANACAACHDKPMGKPNLKTRAQKGDIAFSHAIHTNVATCIDCHKSTATDKQKNKSPIQTNSRCVSCHQENGVTVSASQCASCHTTTEKKTRPNSHKKSWTLRHGKVAEWGRDQGHGNDCSLCHKKLECKTCHRTMKPQSHTALWRIRTHGLSASMDRERCKTCHETGSCINCHRTTAPQNHRGAWPKVHGLAAQASPEKCRVCHSASFGTSSACVECHGSMK
jgi:c(7)-type cytochrome triheme protein